MDHPVLNLLESILEEAAGPSWHQEARRDLGIPEECGPEPLLCLTLTRSGVPMVPVAFVLEDGHLGNVITALEDFLAEAFHPAMHRTGAVAVVDYLPPVDDLGAAAGASRRWALDSGTQTLVLPEIKRFLHLVAS